MTDELRLGGYSLQPDGQDTIPACRMPGEQAFSADEVRRLGKGATTVNVGDRVMFEYPDGRREVMVVTSEPETADDGTVTMNVEPVDAWRPSPVVAEWFGKGASG